VHNLRQRYFSGEFNKVRQERDGRSVQQLHAAAAMPGH
jgi:hypothetical protein